MVFVAGIIVPALLAAWTLAAEVDSQDGRRVIPTVNAIPS